MKSMVILVLIVTTLAYAVLPISVFAQDLHEEKPRDSGEILQPVDMGATTILEGKSSGKIEAFQQKLDLKDPRIEFKTFESGSKAAYSLHGTLDPATMHMWGPSWYDVGDMVTIAITWTPESSVFRIGLTQTGSGIFNGVTVYNGQGTCRSRVNQAGYYWPTVWNVGPSTATYNGYASW